MTLNPKFNNRDNKVYKTKDGEVWASRSTAIVGAIFFVFNDEIFVLAEKRSEKMDSPGLWCIPCGYMDWDENGLEALTREIYEETGLYLPDYKDHGLLNMETPFYVNTDPNENRQNISLSYTNVYRFEESDQEKFNSILSTIKKYKNDEIDKVKLIEIKNIDRYKWAFNHKKRIQSALNFIYTELIEIAADMINGKLIREYQIKKNWWNKILTFWEN